MDWTSRVTHSKAGTVNRLRNFLASTPNRTFILWPVAVAAFELALRGSAIGFHPAGLIAMLWGYLQYRLAGRYRKRRGGGGPGLANPPTHLVTEGPYRWCRNPMYLGHLIFLAGLAWLFASWLAAAVLLFHLVWFDRRVRGDEWHMHQLFGEPYAAYKARVKRWVPGVY